MTKNNFHLKKTKTATDKLYEGLLAAPLAEINQPFELEIIPYEDLWLLILETLDNEFH